SAIVPGESPASRSTLKVKPLGVEVFEERLRLLQVVADRVLVPVVEERAARDQRARRLREPEVGVPRDGGAVERPRDGAARVVVADDLEDELVEIGLALLPVVRVADEIELGALLPAVEHERARPERVRAEALAELVELLLRVDAEGERRESGEERCERLGHRE